jgi:hypothetical protein
MIEGDAKNIEELFFQILDDKSKRLNKDIITKSFIDQLFELLEIDPEFHFYVDDDVAKERFFNPLFRFIAQDRQLTDKLIKELILYYQNKNPIIEDLIYVIILGALKNDFDIFLGHLKSYFIDMLIYCFELYNINWDFILEQYIGNNLSFIVKLKFKEAILNKDNETLFYLFDYGFLLMLNRRDIISLINDSKLNLIEYLINHYHIFDKVNEFNKSMEFLIKLVKDSGSLSRNLMDILNKAHTNPIIIRNIMVSGLLRSLDREDLIKILPIIIHEIRENSELSSIFLKSDILMQIPDDFFKPLSENLGIEFVIFILSTKIESKIIEIFNRLDNNFILRILLNEFKAQNSRLISKLIEYHIFDYISSEEFKELIRNLDINFFALIINSFTNYDLKNLELWIFFLEILGKDISLDQILKKELKDLIQKRNP